MNEDWDENDISNINERASRHQDGNHYTRKSKNIDHNSKHETYETRNRLQDSDNNFNARGYNNKSKGFDWDSHKSSRPHFEEITNSNDCMDVDINVSHHNRNQGGNFSRDGGDRGHGNFQQRDRFSNNIENNAQNFHGSEGGEDHTRPPLYTPQAPSDIRDDIFAKNISEGIDFHKYKNINVHISGGDDKQDFISLFDAKSGICDHILENVKYYGYKTPTPIQKFTIPIIIKGEYDVMGCAQTGSGKTGAFLIPIFSKILEDNSYFNDTSIAAPRLVVIAPTRELTSQIWSEMRKFSYGTPIRTGVVYGGVSRNFIMQYLSCGCDVLAATPGRLLDMTKRGIISLKQVKYLVLDEADRMLDMGFIGTIREIIDTYGMPDQNTRRCLMFSATFPETIQRLAREILAPNYYFLTVGIVGGAADSINQEVFQVMPQEKRDKLVEILETSNKAKVLVFVETKRGADFLTTFLCQKDINATSIHGDRFQEQREEALKSFKSGLTPILVATSVAARGLDIADVEIVLNFDLPSDIDEYVHRIGRTGRLGNKGHAISFFTPGKDDSLSSSLITVLKNAGQDIPEFLRNQDYASGGPTKNYVTSRDDRGISKRVLKAYTSNNFNEDVQCPPLAVISDEAENWD